LSAAVRQRRSGSNSLVDSIARARCLELAAMRGPNLLDRIAGRLQAKLQTLASAETIDYGKPLRETLVVDIPLAIDHHLPLLRRLDLLTASGISRGAPAPGWREITEDH